MRDLSYPLIYQPDKANGAMRPGRGLVALAGLAAVCIGLVAVRGLLTGNWWFFTTLTWNLFLAFFPLGVVLVLRDLRAAGFRQRALLLSSLAIWLAFLPNAPYLITDLFHIRSVGQPLLWFDTMTFFLFAQTGLLAGLYSLLVVHRMLRPLLGVWQTWAVVLLFQGLSGFGVYLGRFGRWNSWDVLAQPTSLLRAILLAYHDHLSIKLTLAYGFVLVALYVAFHWYVAYDKRT
ncbi:DUF1361 domain-containing protein [Spirosoma montaniterrae]|uniref:DUF1361 domain-containing protein n=1 Tax=Spirosoma montaniterrae TaxID=1178516 RepID=A0A1P9WXE5_9BACT|nr:DUF1361 domain-containing protein [Spirosoma montaniterrae]AQG80057.1 hypothetical protein AWR27_12415 [Spirosoma montaniterrae]